MLTSDHVDYYTIPFVHLSLSLSLKPKLPGVFLQHYGVTDRKSLNVDMV